MSLYTLYGINGIGKDTIANELKKRNPDFVITSMSRLYMYLLDITNTYYTSEKVTEEQYKKLENVSQSEMKYIENNQYKELLIKMSKTNNITIFLGHLVSALRLGDNIEYLTDRITPKWFLDINSGIIQLLAPIDIINKRRQCDTTRIRKNSESEIMYHQNLCFNEWNRIMRICEEKMFCVENIIKENSTSDVERILLHRDDSINKEKSNKVLKKYLK